MTDFLKIDEQTISDLSIFGKNGKSSVYDLFNKTSTLGGARKLEAFFRLPLSDHQQINERAEIFRFFSLQDYIFPVDSATIGIISYYLENNDVRSQIHLTGQSISQKLKDMVAADADVVFIQEGVQASLRLYYKLDQYIQRMESRAEESAYAFHFLQLRTIIQGSEFGAVRQYATSKSEVKLNNVQLSDLDKQLRFAHQDTILELLNILYELDVYIAVGQVARKQGFHFAKALSKDSGVLHYKKIYHPHVESAIPNDLRLDGEHNILFLTGANMAGKSTLMKSLGIALYLGHMGFPVAAEVLNLPLETGFIRVLTWPIILVWARVTIMLKFYVLKRLQHNCRQGKKCS